jgi:hypothetical protein
MKGGPLAVLHGIRFPVERLRKELERATAGSPSTCRGPSKRDTVADQERLLIILQDQHMPNSVYYNERDLIMQNIKTSDAVLLLFSIQGG